MDLAVVIVTWNVRDLALDAIRTLREDVAAYGPPTEIWVVDNASADGTAEAIREEFPSVKLVASQENLGFARGNNLALHRIGFGAETSDSLLPNAVFLLNPDTVVHARSVSTLYDALFSEDNVGLVGARLTYGDGAFQHSAFGFPGIWQTMYDLLPMPGRFYESRLNGRYARSLYEQRDPFSVDHMLGATMMLRRQVIQQTGMFDEQFFMYCEEIDWAMRIRKAGWDICCVPAAHITHLEGQSTRQVRPESFMNLWRSRFQLYTKHYSPVRLSLIRTVVRLGMRRKITAAKHDRALSAAQRDALIDAYRVVASL